MRSKLPEGLSRLIHRWPLTTVAAVSLLVFAVGPRLPLGGVESQFPLLFRLLFVLFVIAATPAFISSFLVLGLFTMWGVIHPREQDLIYRTVAVVGAALPCLLLDLLLQLLRRTGLTRRGSDQEFRYWV